jgi:hypothetical protein
MSGLASLSSNALLRRAWNASPSGVKRAIRRLRDPKSFALFEEDYRAFGIYVRWIIEALDKRPAAWKGEVLIHGLHAFAPSFKEEFVLAAVLAWHGYRPVLLVDQIGGIERYASLVPGCRVVDWNRFASPPTASERRQAVDLIGNVGSLRELVGLKSQQVAIGRHALSRFMQQHRLGSIDIARQREALGEQLAASLAADRAVKVCLAREKAQVVLMNERGYTPFGEFFDGALLDGRRVVQYCHAHRDDARVYKAYTLDTRTEHPYSLSDSTWSDALSGAFGPDLAKSLLEEWEAFYRDKTWFNFQRLQHRTSLQDRASVSTKLGLDDQKKTAVIYAHIFWDATFFYGESLYEDYKQWFVDTVRMANQNERLNWVVKLHPVNVWRKERGADGADTTYAEIEALREAGIALEDHVKLLLPETDISSWSLFQASDYCLTVRGTVGMENAALGKRVVTAGSGHYSHRGFTVNPASIEEYRALLLRLETLGPLSDVERERALRYGYWVLRRKPYALGNYEMRYDAGPGVVHALNGSLKVLAHDAERFFETEGVRCWIRWLTASDAADCLRSETS